jgi:sulfur carrier protein
MNVIINGKQYEFDQPVNIKNMLEKLEIKSPWIVVELNMNIVNKDEYETTILKDSDTVEVIGFVGGG